uniref:Peptidyl-prolyl cis-trans isomerase n=1 Tax=Phallusia mammillata TaxID=59560 RepID=A0A6F9DNQ4_9ASCI|nr:peptidyl-prolyl cis-trans isomerase-like 3 [Phallusia mammillata]
MAVTLHTDVGDLKLELYCELTPKAAENFLALCASGYYNNNVFHRNIKGFMTQTGDPSGTGKQGTSIWGQYFEDEIVDSLKHNAKGVVSMANSGPNTNASQFFITYAKQPHIDMKYTIFGRVIDGLDVLDDFNSFLNLDELPEDYEEIVIDGLDVLDELERIPVNEKTYRPLSDVKIQTVTIHANPIADAASVS